VLYTDIYFLYVFVDTYMCPPGALSRHICAYMFMHKYVCLQGGAYIFACIFVNVYMYVDVYI